MLGKARLCGAPSTPQMAKVQHMSRGGGIARVEWENLFAREGCMGRQGGRMLTVCMVLTARMVLSAWSLVTAAQPSFMGAGDVIVWGAGDDDIESYLERNLHSAYIQVCVCLCVLVYQVCVQGCVFAAQSACPAVR